MAAPPTREATVFTFSLKRIVVWGCLLIASIWGTTAVWLLARFDEVETQDDAELTALAHVLSVQTDRHLANADRLLDLVVSRVESERMDVSRMHRLLHRTVHGLPNVRGARVLDRDGHAISDANAIEPTPYNAGDLDFFLAHRADGNRGLVVSPPIRRMVDGRWTIIISRRLNSPNGEFNGIVGMGLEPEFFSQTYEAVSTLGYSSIAIVRSDGSVLTRYPNDEAWLGKIVSPLPSERRGLIKVVSRVDRVARVMAFEKMTGGQLSVVVGRDADAVWKAIQPEVILTIFSAFLLSVASIVALQRLWKNAKETKANVERAEITRDIAIAEQWRFVSIASHEFRTPLASIDGAAQRLGTLVKNNAEAGRKVDRIRSSVQRMISIIDRTLTSAAIVEGKINFDRRPTDLRELLQSCAERACEVSPEFDVAVEAGAEPAIVEADEKRLDQVFTNLIGNAIKFSGGSRRIEISLTGTERYWKVMVRDFGIGIAPGDVPKLFTRFFRGRNAVGITGTGIGLHLVCEIVRMHGGSVGVETTSGDGTTFIVLLPRAIRSTGSLAA